MAGKAVVLSGGGSVGIAWETGVVAGLAEAGIDLTSADSFVGTSAGSVVGAQLALGYAPDAMLGAQRDRSRNNAALAARAETAPVPPNTAGLIEMMARMANDNRPQRERLAEVGRFALEAQPGVFPPITINGRRYYDGGIRSASNADLAAGCETVVVISLAGGAAASGDPRAELARRRLETEIATLKQNGAAVIELIVPDKGSRASFGLNMLDWRRAGPAAEEGYRQGKNEAPRLRSSWS
jgi:NTE family protein